VEDDVTYPITCRQSTCARVTFWTPYTCATQFTGELVLSRMHYYCRDQIKEDEVGGVHSMHCMENKLNKILVGDINGNFFILYCDQHTHK
jgi:hypothetical protein